MLPAVFRFVTVRVVRAIGRSEQPELPNLGDLPIRVRARVDINPGLHTKMQRAIDQKVDAIMKYGREQVRPMTPKRTGTMRNGWKVKGRGYKAELINPVPYSGYVTEKYGLLRKLETLIQRKFR